MKKGFENKIMLQILSVGIAIVLWFIVAYSENPVIDITVKNIPISYTNLSELEERGMTILKENKTPTVSVAVRGNRNELFNVIRNISASIDLSKINSSGSYEMPVDINIPVPSVELIKKKSNNVTIVVEPVVTRTIPVKIAQTGFNNEYMVKSSSDTAEITVSGAKSAVNEVSAALVTVDTSGIKNNSASSYSYSYIDANGNEFETNNVVSETDAIIISNKLFLAKNVPVNIEYPTVVKEDFIVNVKNADSLSANIGVAREYYDDVESLTATFPEDISPLTSATVSLALDVPDSVYIPDGNFIEVKADIIRKEVASINLPITVQNVPVGLKVVEIDSGINILVKGAEDLLSPSLMSAVADLSDLSDGTHKITLKITVPDGVTVVQEYSLNVTLE